MEATISLKSNNYYMQKTLPLFRFKNQASSDTIFCLVPRKGTSVPNVIGTAWSHQTQARPLSYRAQPQNRCSLVAILYLVPNKFDPVPNSLGTMKCCSAAWWPLPHNIKRTRRVSRQALRLQDAFSGIHAVLLFGDLQDPLNPSKHSY